MQLFICVLSSEPSGWSKVYLMKGETKFLHFLYCLYFYLHNEIVITYTLLEIGVKMYIIYKLCWFWMNITEFIFVTDFSWT